MTFERGPMVFWGHQITNATREAVMFNIMPAKSCDMKQSDASSEGLGLGENNKFDTIQTKSRCTKKSIIGSKGLGLW